MSRKRARSVAAAPPEPVATPCCREIPEDAFHQARCAETALVNSFAGETFALSGASYARINDRHFRVDGADLTHAETLALVGQAMRLGGGR